MPHLADFTATERRFLKALFDELDEFGYSQNTRARIAARLNLSPTTVRTRVSRLRAKYAGALNFIHEYRLYQKRIFQRTGGKFNPLSVSGRAAKK